MRAIRDLFAGKIDVFIDLVLVLLQQSINVNETMAAIFIPTCFTENKSILRYDYYVSHATNFIVFNKIPIRIPLEKNSARL